MSEYVPLAKEIGETLIGMVIIGGVAYVIGKMTEHHTEGNVEKAAKKRSRASITSSLVREGKYNTKDKNDLEKLKGTVDYLLEGKDDILSKLKQNSE
jgi:hypothetical protein